MATNIDIKSRDAVWLTLVWKGPTYIVLCCIIGACLGVAPYVVKNHKEQSAKRQNFYELVQRCERGQYEVNGRYDSLMCQKWANTYYRVYDF